MVGDHTEERKRVKAEEVSRWRSATPTRESRAVRFRLNLLSLNYSFSPSSSWSYLFISSLLEFEGQEKDFPPYSSIHSV